MKNRKNNKTYIFLLKNDIFEKKIYLSRTTFFNKKRLN